MNAIIVTILLILVVYFAWTRYMSQLEHGELKAKYSRLNHMYIRLARQSEPVETGILAIAAAPSPVEVASPVPVPTDTNKGRPFVKYEVFSVFAAQGIDSKRTQHHVRCHSCNAPGIIFSDFALHGMGHCPFCHSTMTW